MEIKHIELTYDHVFSTDEVYICTLSVINAVSSYNEVWTFTVQYALENLYFGLWDGGFIDYDILHPPDFRKDVHFVLLSDKNQPRATNVSWDVDFGNGVVLSSTEYISMDDRDPSLSSSQFDHVYSWFVSFDAFDDCIATLELANLISSMNFAQTYRVYEEVYGVELADVVHWVHFYFH